MTKLYQSDVVLGRELVNRIDIFTGQPVAASKTPFVEDSPEYSERAGRAFFVPLHDQYAGKAQPGSREREERGTSDSRRSSVYNEDIGSRVYGWRDGASGAPVDPAEAAVKERLRERQRARANYGSRGQEMKD